MTKKHRPSHLRPRPPAATPVTYPAPEERQRIVARRDKLMKELIHATIMTPNNPAKIDRLIARYGADEVRIVSASLGGPHPPFINENPYLYREYRQIFARFGGDRPFLSKKDYETLMWEFSQLLAVREFKEVLRRPPGERETELRDLLLKDAFMWPDIVPPAPPPRPPDYVAPPADHYGDPVQKLLTWGPDRDEQRYADYARYAPWRRAVPDLVRMALDPGLLNGWPGEGAGWASLHALELLGHIGDAAAGPPLLALLDCENDWLSDRLPDVWGQMGRGAEGFLWECLDDRQQPAEKREVALAGLKAIAGKFPARRPPIIQGLIARLQAAPVDEQEVNAYLVHVLDDMHVPEARAAIMAAFEAGKVDTTIIAPADME